MDGIDEVVAGLRRTGAESTQVEVKAAAGGLPKSCRETLSAFANGSGGTLVLGLSDGDFAPVAGFDATAVREALSQVCAEQLTPPLRIPVEIADFEGSSLVVAEVSELDPTEKPCFVTSQGTYGGAYVRAGEGDRHLSHYEITQLLSNRSQPDHDRQTVPDASLDDLDPQTVAATVARARSRSPRAFSDTDDDDVLVKINAASRLENGTVVPTLAGLLSLGRYPQQYFPQLFVAVVVLPTTVKGESGAGGERFTDNVTVEGSIPEMVAETTRVLQRNMNRAAVIRGIGREDRFDYPTEVIRELVANALMHRDYSPEGRGSHVQVELYPDRLVVQSTGGLYGSVFLEELGTSDVASSTRNAALAKILIDVPLAGAGTVVENRGTGLLHVSASLRAAGMSPPAFDARPAQLLVTVPRTALLGPEAITWIGSLPVGDLSDSHHLALALLRATGQLNVAMLRAWGLDATTASGVVRELTARRLIVRSGGRRYAQYHLVPQPPTAAPHRAGESVDTPHPQHAAVIEAIRAGHTTARAIADVLHIAYQPALRRLNRLIDDGQVARNAPRNSRYQSYRLTEEQP